MLGHGFSLIGHRTEISKVFAKKNDMIWNHLATISPLYSCRSCPTLTSWVTKQPWPAPAIRLCRTFGGISQDLL